MSRSLVRVVVRLLLHLLIAALPLQGYAAGGCCARSDQAPVPHCGMHAMAGMHMTDDAASHQGQDAHAGAGCAMHAAHHHHGDADGAADNCSSCASCCAAAFALPPALPTLTGDLPLRVAHAPPLAPFGSHIPAGLERPPRLILS